MSTDVILIAAVTVDGYIARHNLEVTSWTEDLQLFKEQTTGFPIIMGSNTYSTLSAELEGRKTIVVHRNEDPKTVLSSIKDEQCFEYGDREWLLKRNSIDVDSIYNKIIKQINS